MIVRCTRILTPHTREAERDCLGITPGQYYLVLELVAISGRPLLYRILSDERLPALHDHRQFVVVTSYIPPNWVTVKNDYGAALRPGNWARPGFWEAYLAGDAQALEDFTGALLTLRDEDDKETREGAASVDVRLNHA